VENAIDGSHLLVAAGRTPNTADIGLELAGVDSLRTSHLMIFEYSVTISVAVSTSQPAGKFHSACSPIPNLPASA
jgi:hypothetical protein